MELAKSPQRLLHCLKTRGPQSVKILAKQLGMTTMGARQHLTALADQGLVSTREETRQTRGRPVHLWQLTTTGHQQFPDSHSQITVELIDVLRHEFGEDGLSRVITARNDKVQGQYEKALDQAGSELTDRVRALAAQRSMEGYMAEVRLLPDGWMLIENHCPICAAAESCQQFCHAELTLFQSLFNSQAKVERVDHLLSGARRCAYKITPLA
ncbi:MAG: metalloregulator ArsR/SmtB family transcription factor [Gammaproteobacteria bacterium]